MIKFIYRMVYMSCIKPVRCYSNYPNWLRLYYADGYVIVLTLFTYHLVGLIKTLISLIISKIRPKSVMKLT